MLKNLKRDTNLKLNILTALLASIIVVSNCTVVKTFEFFKGFTMSVAPLCFILTFFISNLISYHYGQKEAFKSLIIGFLCQIVCTVIIVLLDLIPGTDSNVNSAFSTLLGQNWLVVVASLTAFMFSEGTNTLIFNFILKKLKNKYWFNGINNLLSCIIGQVVDACVFNTLLFGCGMGQWNTLGSIILTTILLKVIVCLIYSPSFYLLTIKRGIKNGQGKKVY